jgi:hypothetical protein
METNELNEPVYEKMYKVLMDSLSRVATEIRTIQANDASMFKRKYSYAFNKISDIVDELNDAQLHTESIYVDEASVPSIMSLEDFLRKHGCTIVSPIKGDFTVAPIIPRKLSAGLDELDDDTVSKIQEMIQNEEDEEDSN